MDMLLGHCFIREYLAKRSAEQLMAPMLHHWVGPAPPFESTALDLFRPLTFQNPYNNRKTVKAQGIVFLRITNPCCMWR
jgi:hypothetical protein